MTMATHVSPQDIRNHLVKYIDNWAQMEQVLLGFMGNRIIIDYKLVDQILEVTVDGQRGPIRIQVKEPAKAPAEAQETPAEATAPQKRRR